MAKKQALGKGLGALLPEYNVTPQEGEMVQMLDIQQIHPNPDQPRKQFDETKLAELAESIKEHGIMQPLLITKVDGDYLLVAGERRWRAASLAGLEQVPCLVREMTPGELAEISLIENIQREDLSALEEARAYQCLIKEHNYTQEQLAGRLGKSRPYIANTMRLLQLAPQEAQALADGRISPGHGRALLSVADKTARGRLFAAILKEGLTVRQAEEMAHTLQGRSKAPSKQSRVQRLEQAILQELEKEFTSGFGLPARLQGTGSKGKLIVEYNSEDDLQNILDKLR